jgi:hypothetical protein
MLLCCSGSVDDIATADGEFLADIQKFFRDEKLGTCRRHLINTACCFSTNQTRYHYYGCDISNCFPVRMCRRFLYRIQYSIEKDKEIICGKWIRQH